MSQQKALDLPTTAQPNEDRFTFEPIKGYPMLNWRGKRPFTSTAYYPAQLKEQHGKDVNGWLNKIFWGDNLQVMAHLLKEYRGKVDLIYIDPPFDSKADYKKQIRLNNSSTNSEQSIFEEKQYTDIWTNDDYLQFMYERLVLIRQLMSDKGVLFLHCDWHKSHYLRCICDEIYGYENFQNEIIWKRGNPRVNAKSHFSHNTDTILFYSKSKTYNFKLIYTPLEEEYYDKYYSQVCEITGKRFMPSPLIGHVGTNKEYEWKGFIRAWRYPKHRLDELNEAGRIYWPQSGEGIPRFKKYIDEVEGRAVQSLWSDINGVNSQAIEDTQYPTQKPEALLERIISCSTTESSIIFDCFMGSGTTQAVAMKLGRRFIGADINLGAIQTTTKRLIKVAQDLEAKQAELDNSQPELLPDKDAEDESETAPTTYYTGFEVYNVNHYDVFRNPVQAKDLLIEALGIQRIPNSIYDGEKDGRMVKIMPINRIATRADLNELIAGVDYKTYEERSKDTPNRVVEKMLLVCMGHEPDLAAALKQAIGYKIDVEIVDILRDKTDLQFKRDSEAKLAIEKKELIIKQFYPMNLLQKLSQTKESVSDWREMVESVMVDWNYDGVLFQPSVTDIPSKNELVIGHYSIPETASTIRVKITDLLSESWEGNING